MITVLLELPIFYYTEDLINLLDVHGMLTVSAIAYIFRTYIYTILTENTV